MTTPNPPRACPSSPAWSPSCCSPPAAATTTHVGAAHHRRQRPATHAPAATRRSAARPRPPPRRRRGVTAAGITPERCAANKAAGQHHVPVSFDFAAAASILDVVVAKEKGYFDDMCLDVE